MEVSDVKVCEWDSTRLKLSCSCLFVYPRYFNFGFWLELSDNFNLHQTGHQRIYLQKNSEQDAQIQSELVIRKENIWIV